jgi:hypothetical protein
LLGAGVSVVMADVRVGSDLARKLGQFAPATTDVLTLTGQPPTSVRALVKAHREALLHPPAAVGAH